MLHMSVINESHWKLKLNGNIMFRFCWRLQKSFCSSKYTLITQPCWLQITVQFQLHIKSGSPDFRVHLQGYFYAYFILSFVFALLCILSCVVATLLITQFSVFFSVDIVFLKIENQINIIKKEKCCFYYQNL